MVDRKEKINISGVAVREGISRNNKKYISKELKKFAPTMIGRPIIKDHEGTTDSVIGKITHAESMEDGKFVSYRGWVKEDGTGILEKIRDGRISEVSIGAFSRKVVKDKEDENILIPIDMEALEMSTTPIPGVIGTSLFADENTKEKEIDLSEESIKKMIEDYEAENNSHSSQDDTNIIKREENMESEQTQKESAIVDNSKELEAMKEKIASLEKEKLSLEEARKQDAIKRYNEKAKAKKLPLKDLSKASMETIQAMTEMVEELPEDEDEKSEEEEDKEEEKVKATPKSKEIISAPKSSESFKDYVLTNEDTIGKVAFFKFY